MSNQYTPLLIRFEAKYIPEPNSGCWLWLGAYAGGKPGNHYPVITNDGRQLFAHRVSHELFKGPIPDGAFICHKCDTPLCVNPDHLYVGSAKTNCNDCVSRKRHAAFRYPEIARERGRQLGLRIGGRNKGKKITREFRSACKRGHPLTGENLYFAPSGTRACRACRARQGRIQKARHTARAALAGEKP